MTIHDTDVFTSMKSGRAADIYPLELLQTLEGELEVNREFMTKDRIARLEIMIHSLKFIVHGE